MNSIHEPRERAYLKMHCEFLLGVGGGGTRQHVRLSAGSSPSHREFRLDVPSGEFDRQQKPGAAHSGVATALADTRVRRTSHRRLARGVGGFFDDYVQAAIFGDGPNSTHNFATA